MSSSSDTSGRKYINGRKRVLYCCSTPLMNESPSLSTVNISTVGTNSSSGGKEKIKSRVGKHRELTRKVQNKRQKYKKSVRINKRRKANAAENSDADWETNSEQSVLGDVSRKRSSVKRTPSIYDDVLFKDLPSPQRVRDACHSRYTELDSPPLRLRRSRYPSPQKGDVEKECVVLHEKDIPTMNLVDEDDDDEDSSPSFRITPEDAKKSYPGKMGMQKGPFNLKPEIRLMKVKLPTATSNLLWDKFMNTAPRRKSSSESSVTVSELCRRHKILKGMENKDKPIEKATQKSGKESRTSRRIQRKSPKPVVIRGRWDTGAEKFVQITVNNDDEDKPFEKTTQKSGKESRTSRRIQRKSPKPVVIRGRSDTGAKKFVQITDEYKFSEVIDVEQKEYTGERRITLDQFRRRQKAEKEKLRIAQESMSFTETNKIIKKDVEDPKENVHRLSDRAYVFSERQKILPKRRKRSVREILSGVSANFGNTSPNALNFNAERENKISTSVPHVNANNKTIDSNETSSDESNSLNARSGSIIFKTRGTKRNYTKGMAIEAKRQRMDINKPSSSGKPRITSINLLRSKCYKKLNDKIIRVKQ